MTRESEMEKKNNLRDTYQLFCISAAMLPDTFI